MTDSQIPPAGSAGDSGAVDSSGGEGAPVPAPVKKRRRWRWVVGGIAVVLVLLVIFTPTIASMGFVREMVVGQINKSLDGTVQIGDWSLGWMSGIEVSGVRVMQDGGQIAEMRRLSTQLTVLGAIRGKYDLGKTKIEGLDVLVKIYPDGRTNLHRLLKLKEKSEGPVKVPAVTGEIEADVRGTIAREGQQPILIDASVVKATVTDINKAIAHQMDLAVRVGGAGTPGKVRAGGWLKLFEKNTLDLGQLSVDENVVIEGVDLASVGAVLGQDSGIERLEGKLNGGLTAKAAGADQVVVAGTLVCDGLAVGGKMLAGDTYRSGRVTVKIPQTTFDGGTGQIRGQGPITVETNQGSLALAVDATQGALKNLAGNRAPGSAGRVSLAADFDFAKLAEQLPHLLRMKEGIKPVSGKIKQTTEIVLAVDKATVKSRVDLMDLVATDAKGVKIEAQPIHLSLAAASLGGGGVVPDLRDIGLELRSGFATMDGKGESLAKLNIDGKANLADLQREAGQFVNMGGMQMVGEAKFNVTSSGQLAKEDDTASLEAVVSGTGVQIRDGQAMRIDEPWLEMTLKGKLVRGKQEFVKAIREGALTVRTGNKDKPTVDVAATAEVAMGGEGKAAVVPGFELVRCNVDLAGAQKEFAWAGDTLREVGWIVPVGKLAVTGSGSWDGVTAGIKWLKVAATDDLSLVSAKSLNVNSSFGNLSVADAVVRLPRKGSPVSPLDMVQKATVSVDLPDLARASKMVEGIMKSEPVKGAAVASAAAGPMVLKSGNLKAALRVERSAKGLALNVDNLSGEKIVMERGKGKFELAKMAMRLAAVVVADTKDPARPLLEQISEIQVTDLAGNAGEAMWMLAEPISIKGLGGTMQVSGAVKVTGTLRQVSDLLEAMQGQASGTAYAYSGAYTLTQRLKTEGAGVSLVGEMGIDNFAVGNERKPRFAEKAVRVAEEITLDQKAKSIAIKKLILDMADSKALGLAINGTVGDYTGQRTLDNMKVLVSYDAAKLLEIARPMLSAEQQAQLGDLKLSGVVRDRELMVGGKYPVVDEKAQRRGTNAIQFVKASGVLSFDRVEYEGMAGEFKEVPFVLADGVARLVYADRAPGKELPAAYPLNGGKMDLGGLEVAFGGAELRVNSPRKDYQLLENVTINRSFVEKYLGQLNPLFTVPKNAKGVIYVTVNEMAQLPLGAGLTKPKRGEAGRGKFTFSITNLELDSLFMHLLAAQLQLKLNADGALPSNIRDGVVEIAGGVVKSDMGLDVGGQVIGVRHTEISLADEKIRSMEMTIPKAMLTQALLARMGSQQSLIKDNIVVPVKGTLSKTEFDIIGAAVKSVNVPGVLEQLLRGVDGGKKEK